MDSHHLFRNYTALEPTPFNLSGNIREHIIHTADLLTYTGCTYTGCTKIKERSKVATTNVDNDKNQKIKS